MKLNSFAKYSWFVLIYNIGVVLFGAFVRATGSGAGCGSHWPLCNGEVLPRPERIETIIEFSHRLTSGVALLLVIGMIFWAFRIYPKGHILRFGASLSMFFIITEALVGASLVLFGWVDQDASVGRAISISVHLVNTFLLLGSLTLTAWWASGGKGVRLQGQGLTLWALAFGFLGMMILGMTGAITALGDTLFPAESFTAGLQQDLDPTAHFLIRLRVFHPITAIFVGFYLIFVSALIAMFRGDAMGKKFAISFSALFIIQLGAGLVNMLLNAPVAMQLIHLFLADVVWINLVLFSAHALADQQVETGWERKGESVVSAGAA